VHSGWWSEDKQYMFVHDEQDEQRLGLNTTLRVFSLADLTAPVLSGHWEGTTSAIDHNGFVRGNRYYMSNYSRGLTILDISDPVAPVTSGSLDTYPFSNTSSFVGAWGTYPFYFSGTVAVSDIDTGLYLARDRSLEVPQGSFSFGAPAYGAEEGRSAQLIVQRAGGSSGSVSVNFETVNATTDASDYQLVSERLSWASGDASDRVIDVPLANDGIAEGLERLLVRLVDPGGSATLGERNVASLFISDPATAAEIGFFADSIQIAERGFATAVLVLQRYGSVVGAASVDFAISGGDAVPGSDFDGTTAGTLHWDAGDGLPKNLLFSIRDDGSAEGSEFFEVTLSNAGGAAVRGPSTARVDIVDASGFNVAPNAVAGSSQTVPEGVLVTLDGEQSSDPDGDSLAFQWTQAAGPAVTLSDAQTAVARFTSPSVEFDTVLRFQLTVTDPDGLSDTAATTVTVTGSMSGSGGGSAWDLLILLCAATAGRAAARHQWKVSNGWRFTIV